MCSSQLQSNVVSLWGLVWTNHQNLRLNFCIAGAETTDSNSSFPALKSVPSVRGGLVTGLITVPVMLYSQPHSFLSLRASDHTVGPTVQEKKLNILFLNVRMKQRNKLFVKMKKCNGFSELVWISVIGRRAFLQ